MVSRVAGLLFAWTLLSASIGASTVQAQGYPFSQRSTISQKIAFTEIKIEYGRPTARGRTLWGALVPWDSIWHPGADQATEIAFSRDVTLDGQPVTKGTYTAWLIPRAQGTWTFILNRRIHIQHTPYAGVQSEALRLEVMPDSASHLETLTWMFPMVLRDEATVRMQWGTQGISMRIKAAYKPQ